MMKKSLLLILFFYMAFPGFSQQKLDTLSWQDFKNILIAYHPVAARAGLLDRFARARMNQAWGNFDPKVSVLHDQKNFDGTMYYRFLTPELKIPLWYGIELKTNYAEAEGAYINPENRLPQEGLSFMGLNLTLGKGLLIDQRRAALRQARVFTEASANEQLRIMNDLMLEAGEAYLNWQYQFKVTQVYEQALVLTKTRYDAVKDAFEGGDRPAIDTIEALTQIQQREIQWRQSLLDLQNAFYQLGSFLWLENNEPADLAQLNLIPQRADISLPVLIDTSILNNPKLAGYNFKLRELEIERRLKAESLRPTVDLQLGFLNSGTNALKNVNTDYWQNNNKVGVQVAFPLTFTSARADLATAKLKIRDTELEQYLVSNDLSVKMKQNRAEAATLESQLGLISQSVQASQQLQEGEALRFRFGESSLFLVNARETKLLETQEKLLETQNKILKNRLKAAWISGSLAN